MTHFDLDPRLRADTHMLVEWPLCSLLLMDDARYPWLILVPRIPGMRDLIDLDEQTRIQLRREMDAAAMAMRDIFTPDKLNVASLGNVVEQLHVHVIARYVGDDAWPAPVWGAHPRVRRDDAAREAMIHRLRPALPAFAFSEETFE